MLINEIQIKKKTAKKRLGRGGKRGTYSGRGQKGQKARAGHRIIPAERELIQRLPKFRGYKNRNTSRELLVLNVGDLDKFKETKINPEFLKKKKFLNKGFRGEIKILGKGEIKSKVEIRDISVSKSAQIKIEKAGGKIMTSEKK
ncbi:MAG: 50S ribosomal protein L15 [Candidatus Pacebacteria bacterium]|nr:50S ribosomal protein L15 [Candidatus Paceibacterota bacterium]